MFRNLLLLTFLCCSSLAFAQKDGDAKISIGVRGYTYSEMPRLFNQVKDHQYVSSTFNSYIIKFNDNLFSYRLNGSYLNKSLFFQNDCEGCGLIGGKVKDYAFKVGFEKNFSYTGLQPYFALDLGYRGMEFNGSEERQKEGHFMLVNSNKRGFTVTPVLGLKVSPIKELSIFAETNMEFFYAFGKERSTVLAEDAASASHKFKKGELLLNPIAVGIQFHFR